MFDTENVVKPWVHLAHCQEKALRGNVYESEALALRVASDMSRKKRANIVAYRCKACGKFHVGRAR